MKSFINLLDEANAEIKTISVTELKSIMNQSDIVIIDVQSKDVIEKVMTALKPGSKLVFHEYYNWSTHSVFPEHPTIKHCIGSALKSFKDSDSEIDVGAYIPQYLHQLGASIQSTRLMTKLAEPGTDVWKWPITFYESYFPRLVEMGYLKKEMIDQAFSELKTSEALPYARLACPMMIEIIAEKR